MWVHSRPLASECYLRASGSPREPQRLPATTNQRVYIEFDGIYRNSEVWINGHSLGFRPYGYSSFRYHLTPWLNKPGQPNCIAVRVNNAANLIHFTLEGPAEIAGVDNGYQASPEPFQARYRKAYNGKCLIIIRSKEKAGAIHLRANADGLTPATITILTHPAFPQRVKKTG